MCATMIVSEWEPPLPADRVSTPTSRKLIGPRIDGPAAATAGLTAISPSRFSVGMAWLT
jgi:hypothetical protein